MNILITGVHGFVGSNLVKALSLENVIYGLDIVTPEKEGVVKTFSWDDLDSTDFPQIDAIIHLAGKAHDTRNKSAADVYFKVNKGLTQRIFDWYLTHESTKKFIFFSTVKSASDRVEGECLTEECVPTPVGPYGESKIKAENYIIGHFAPKALKRPYHNFDDSDSVIKDKQVYIMRPCMIHGPGNKGNLNLLYGVVSKGDDVFIGLNVCICSSVTIGKGTIIGAGSVVTKDISPYRVWAGNSTRYIKDRAK